MKLVDPEVWKLDLLLFHGCNEKTAWLIDRINHAPTIDAVPVIRCKDCKYYKWEIDMCNLEGATVFPMNVVYEDDYCSRAERKDKNDSCQSV